MSTSPNIRHSSASPKWGTGPRYVNIVHQVIGHPTVDPFSESRWNGLIQATNFLDGSKGRDGFKDSWIEGLPRADFVRVGIAPECVQMNENSALVNPPGDERGVNVPLAWRILTGYWDLGWLGFGAVWAGFNLNQFQTCQIPNVLSPLAGEFLRCIPSSREPFIPYEENPDQTDAPSHPSFLLLLPAKNPVIAESQRQIFTRACAEFGEVF